MLTLLIFLMYLGVVLLLAAQLYFPVYQVLEAYWEIRPDRVFYRLAMLIAILGFWPFLTLLGINNRYALGYTLERRQFIQTLLKGLCVGVAIMAVHAGLLLLSGVRAASPEAFQLGWLSSVLLSGLISGLMVAFIEETFFRGAMQNHLRYSNPLLTTAIITSLFYASVHFTRPPAPIPGMVIDWSSGWEMLEGMLHQYRNFGVFVDSFVALFIAGLLLSLVREKSGNIALCIGIHAGWVMGIRLARELTVAVPDAPAAGLIGSYDGIIGWAAAAVLGLVTLGYWAYGYKSSTK